MASVLVSSVIDAPIAQAWEAARRFDAVAELLPFVKTSPIEGDREPTAVGAVRVVTQTDGAVFREAELVGLMEENFLAGLHALDSRLGRTASTS